MLLADLRLTPPSGQLSITLQEPDADGITDLELRLPDSRLLAILEAKKYGWPRVEQLLRYTKKLGRNGAGRCALVPLGVPPIDPSLSNTRQLNGIRIVSKRWADILRMVSESSFGRPPEQAGILAEIKFLIEEVIKMRSYDREVLVRDLKADHPSSELFADDNLYRCKTGERAEPLFFAPCFTGAKNRRANGIHFVSRVYCRSIVKVSRPESLKAALVEATEAVDRISKPLRSRKTTQDQLEYLDGLRDKWRRGLLSSRMKTTDEQNVVFFLGDPMRLPVPLSKKGSMVPPGFSMTMEQLMNARPGVFKC